jgi:tagaturonate epimerase
LSGSEIAGGPQRLGSVDGLELHEWSPYSTGNLELGLAESREGTRLAVFGPSSGDWVQRFEGARSSHGKKTLVIGPISPSNAAALRAELPWLRPRTLGLATSIGFGDRLGLATQGHIRALRKAGGDLAPIFAQQSIREMERTRRSPQQVMDDATWGAFASGWRGGFGADADHLKTFEHIDSCLEVGYTFFTFDPGEHVDDGAEAASPEDLVATLDALPWEALEDTLSDLKGRYIARTFDFGGRNLEFDERTLYVAAVKYSRAVAHVAQMYRHLRTAAGDRDVEVEVSVDETESPTTHAQHVYIVNELARLGVKWVSLAPRYVGTFEKGVDYIGDVREFEADFAVHAAIARKFGPYKLSLHSGSDKFSIYSIAAEKTRGLIHLKTAGTSYLEALRTIASLDPALFREIYAFSRERFGEDRASYHVSASLEAAPQAREVKDSELPGLLEQFDAREILHVTFGSVLGSAEALELREALMRLLRSNPEAYADRLESHFVRHLEPFSSNRNPDTP